MIQHEAFLNILFAKGITPKEEYLEEVVKAPQEPHQ